MLTLYVRKKTSEYTQMDSNYAQLYALLAKHQGREQYNVHQGDGHITVYNNTYSAVPIRFCPGTDGIVKVHGVIGFYDSDYQRKMILDLCNEEKLMEEKEDTECAAIGWRKLPSFDFTIRPYDETREVHIVSSFSFDKIVSNPQILFNAINESERFAVNARMRFGHFILESSRTRIITSKEERRYFSTLMCSCPPGIHGQHGWFSIDLADVVNRGKGFKTSSVIHVEGANSKEELRDNIIKSLDGLFLDDDYLCLRYVFPEWPEKDANPFASLLGFDKYDDCLTRRGYVSGPFGIFPGEREPAYTASIILFSNRTI